MEFKVCKPIFLPDDKIIEGSRRAIEHNPQNSPVFPSLHGRQASNFMAPWNLAVMTGKNWKTGSTLTVDFMEATPEDLANRILAHANAWYDGGVNIKFVRSKTDPIIRITRSGDGYWSYIGTDILSIPPSEATMCLQDFTMQTPESEYRRVVRHEVGHSCGWPHEHSRREIVSLLDPSKTINYFKETQGWDEDMIRQQILIPLEESSYTGSADAETDSIMCYQFPGACTKSGKPIIGGTDITPHDFAFAKKVYPLTQVPIKPQTVKTRGSATPGGAVWIYIQKDGEIELRYKLSKSAWLSPKDKKTIVWSGNATLVPPVKGEEFTDECS